MKKKLASILLVLGLFSANAQDKPESKKMEWFDDAKLGIFIHWGIYSVEGISESWAFFNNYINHDNYMKQLNGFTASQYQPEEWVKLIKDSGAKYAVITTKHHDGISLWDSKAEKAITTKNNAGAKKDVLTPFITSLKKSGLQTGLYFSLPDWSHPYYDINTKTKKRYEIKDQPELWNQYVKYYQTQLDELSTQFKPDLLWFDGDWEHTSEEWRAPQTLANLKKVNPNIIINSRLNTHGDYETPEQGIPVVQPQSRFWELCYTMNDSWGYQPFDSNYKSPNMIVRTLADVISMGGNLLLDIGPKEDGSIPKEQIEILKNLGRWTSKNSEAIYGTKQGIPFENFKGKSALSKDQKTLYLYLDEVKDFVKIKGVSNAPISTNIIGNLGEKLNSEFINSEIKINLNKIKFDQDVTVVELKFKDPIKLTPIGKSSVKLNSILRQKNTKEASYQIAEELHSGNNLLNKSGLTQDGLNMSLPISSTTNQNTINWISKHAEALYDTGKGMPDGHYSGMSALSKDQQTLYLFVEGKPTGPVALKGIKNNIARIRIVGEGSIISSKTYNKLYWSNTPGIVYIDIPKERLDDNLTVIAVLLDKPIDLYRDKVGAIENNQ